MSFFTDVKISALNLTMNDFEHPRLEVFERYCIPIQFCLTSIAFVAFIYVAAFHSPKTMKSYSYLLIYHICATYIFDLITIIIQPVLLLPYIGAYVNGFFLFSEEFNNYIFLLFMFMIVLVFHSFVLQLLFRLATLHSSKNWFSKLAELKYLLAFGIPSLLFLLGILTLGFVTDKPEGKKFREMLIKEYSFFNQIFDEHPNAIGFHPNFSNSIRILLAAIAFIGYITPFLLLFIYYLFYRRIKYVKDNLTEKNRSLHEMLLRALVAQSFLYIILLLIPLEIIATSFVFPYKAASFASSCAPVAVTFHTILEITCQFYFITPYRKWIIQKFQMTRLSQIYTTTT